jgi:hypothetical protein
MSGERRLHSIKLERDRPLFFMMFGFVVLGLATKWLFPFSGWTPMDIFGR